MMRPDVSKIFRAAGGHPLRWEILTAIRWQESTDPDGEQPHHVTRDEPISPNELAELLGVPLTNTSYHVRVLADHMLIECVGTTPRRGALEHYYTVTPLGGEFLSALDALVEAIGPVTA